MVHSVTTRERPIRSVNVQLSLPITGVPIEAVRQEDGSGNCNQLQKITNVSAAVAKYVSAALADNTRLAYQGDLADFIAFGGRIPCGPEQLAHYIANRAQIHSPYTIARRVVGISRAHTSQGMTDPAKNDLVRAVLRGVRRKNGTPQRQVAPLLKCDILSIMPLLQGTKGIRDRALILLGFAAALRRSELVALDVQDVHFVKEGAIVHVRRSKTDQIGEGRKIAVPYGRTSTCPVKALETWLTHAKLAAGPLFRPANKGGGVGDGRLTGQVVALVLKAYAAAAGLNAADISGHSLRAGLVTSAAMAGVSVWKIKAQSGHKSDAMVARYIRDANLFDGNAAGAVL